MVPKKKKVSLWFIILGAILSSYAGYLLNGAWEPGGDINTFLSSFNRVCAAPFANYYNAWRELEKFYEEGKVRAIGVSNFDPAQLADLIAYNKVC